MREKIWKVCNGPYTCPCPPAAEYRWNNRWRCPGCGVQYRKTFFWPRWEVVRWPWRTFRD